MERECGLGQRVEEPRVPAEQHLVVEPGTHALLPRREQMGECALHRRRPVLGAVHDVKDVAPEAGVRILEVPALGDAEVADHLVGIATAHGVHLGERPAEELALHALGVGIFRREETAVRMTQVAQHIRDDLLGDAPVARLPRDQPSVHVRAQEQRLVVEHLLEVRHEPERVDRVAVEPAPHLVVHASGGHGVERHRDHLQRLR